VSESKFDQPVILPITTTTTPTVTVTVLLTPTFALLWCLSQGYRRHQQIRPAGVG
jgi:hypothetical protein